MSVNQDLKATGLARRVCLIIYLVNASDQYKLRKYGDIVYFSKKMKYCVVYVDEDDAKREKNEISALKFVKKVEFSEKDDVDLDSEHIEKQITEMAKDAEEKLQKKNEDLMK